MFFCINFSMETKISLGDRKLVGDEIGKILLRKIKM